MDELVGLLVVAGVGKQKHAIGCVFVLNTIDVLGCPNVNVAPPKSRYFGDVSADHRIHLIIEGRGKRFCEAVVGGEGANQRGSGDGKEGMVVVGAGLRGEVTEGLSEDKAQ